MLSNDCMDYNIDQCIYTTVNCTTRLTGSISDKTETVILWPHNEKKVGMEKEIMLGMVARHRHMRRG